MLEMKDVQTGESFRDEGVVGLRHAERLDEACLDLPK